MLFFAEHMQALAENIRGCRKERAMASARLHKQTQGFLAEAQGFLRHLHQEHLAMATHLRCTLAANHRTRCERVQEFRQEHERQQRERRGRLQDLLHHTRRHRQEHLNRLRNEFQKTRHALAEDFRRAAQAWRQ